MRYLKKRHLLKKPEERTHDEHYEDFMLFTISEIILSSRCYNISTTRTCILNCTICLALYREKNGCLIWICLMGGRYYLLSAVFMAYIYTTAQHCTSTSRDELHYNLGVHRGGCIWVLLLYAVVASYGEYTPYSLCLRRMRDGDYSWKIPYLCYKYCKKISACMEYGTLFG